jgi:hypothetical protein
MATKRFYKSATHERYAQLNRATNRASFSPMGQPGVDGAISGMWRVQVDLRPLAGALANLPSEYWRSRVLRIGMYRTLGKLKVAYKEQLTVWTGINRSKAGRLNRGVHIWTTNGIPVKGIYRISDVHLMVTKEYFNARYTRAYGKPGASVRWGRGDRGWPGVPHTAWGRSQIAKGAFMLPGKKPAFRRWGKGSKQLVAPLWGPNPAKELKRHESTAIAILQMTAKRYYVPEVMRAYEFATQKVKARYGL